MFWSPGDRVGRGLGGFVMLRIVVAALFDVDVLGDLHRLFDEFRKLHGDRR